MSTNQQICLFLADGRPGTKFYVGSPLGNLNPLSTPWIKIDSWFPPSKKKELAPIKSNTLPQRTRLPPTPPPITRNNPQSYFGVGPSSSMMANTNNSTQQQSVSMNPTGSSASFLPVVMSPPDQAIEHHTGFAQVLFEGEVDVNDIPSIHICSLLQEPPVVGVNFDVRNEDGGISDQVFERSYLYRLTGTQGSLRSRRNVRYPNNG